MKANAKRTAEIMERLRKEMRTGFRPEVKHLPKKARIALLFTFLREIDLRNAVGVEWLLGSFPHSELTDREALRLCAVLSRRGFHREVAHLLERFLNRNETDVLAVASKATMAKIAKNALDGHAYKQGAQMLIWFNLWNTDLISTEDIHWYMCTCVTCRPGDHGLHRLFAIYLNRLSGHNGSTLSAEQQQGIANLIGDVLVHWDDALCAQIMHRGVKELFPKQEKKVERLARARARNAVKHIQREIKQAFACNLTPAVEG